MKNQKGFVSLPVLTLGILILAAGSIWYFVGGRNNFLDSSNENSQTKTYTNAEYGFSFQYPASLSVQTSGLDLVRPTGGKVVSYIQLRDDAVQTEGYMAVTVGAKHACEPTSSTPTSFPINGINFLSTDDTSFGIERSYATSQNSTCYVVQVTAFPSACVSSGCRDPKWSAATEQEMFDRLETIARTFKFD